MFKRKWWTGAPVMCVLSVLSQPALLSLPPGGALLGRPLPPSGGCGGPPGVTRQSQSEASAPRAVTTQLTLRLLLRGEKLEKDFAFF